MIVMSFVVAGGVFAAALAASLATFLYLPVFVEHRGRTPDGSSERKGWRSTAVSKAQWAFAAIMSVLVAVLMVLAKSAGTGWTRLLRSLLAALYLMSAAIFDFRSRLIPNFLTLAAFAGGALLAAVELAVWGASAVAGLIAYALGGSLSFCIFYLLSRLTHDGLGMGDVKLIAAAAWLIGFEHALFSVLLGLFACAAVALVLLIGKKKEGTDHLPFGPFIFLGYMILLFFSFFKYLPGISG